MIISYYCCLLSLLLLRLCLACRLVVGKNGAGFVCSHRLLLCCAAGELGAWSCATAHDHGLLRLRRHPGAPWAHPMASMFVRGVCPPIFLVVKVSYPNKREGTLPFFPAVCRLSVLLLWRLGAP